MKTFLSRIQAAGLMTTVFLLFTACTGFAQTARRPDILISDFESETYGEWKAEGEAFGSGPAAGPLAGQMQVSGFRGKRLVNSFFNGDRTTGTLTSPEFTIQRPWINFLIGGGGHEGKTCLNLLVNGKVVRSEVGANTSSGGSEEFTLLRGMSLTLSERRPYSGSSISTPAAGDTSTSITSCCPTRTPRRS